MFSLSLANFCCDLKFNSLLDLFVASNIVNKNGQGQGHSYCQVLDGNCQGGVGDQFSSILVND